MPWNFYEMPCSFFGICWGLKKLACEMISGQKIRNVICFVNVDKAWGFPVCGLWQKKNKTLFLQGLIRVSCGSECFVPKWFTL